MAMDLYKNQPLKASEVTNKDIKRLERLKKKANETAGEQAGELAGEQAGEQAQTQGQASKVYIDRSQSDISSIEQDFEIMD